MNHDVFISYSSKNKDTAIAICHVLEENEIKCWMAPRDIPAGSEYGDLIDDAIKCSKVVVVLFSETAANSLWVKGELNVAFEEQKVIVPFRLDKTPLKGQNRLILNQKHWIDAYPDYRVKFKDLVNAVKQSLGKGNVEGSNDSYDSSRNIKVNKMYLLIGLISVILIAAIFMLYPLLDKYMHAYSYDNQGLHVKIKGLSTKQEEALTSILDNMVLIEGGCFIMGNNYNNVDCFTEQDSLSRNPHNVKLCNYYISKYELTQSDWEAFSPIEGMCIEYADNKPLDMLSWDDAASFTDMLSSVTGLDISMPTEAQWEYAARGGKKSRNYIFSGHNYDVREVAWTSFDNLTSANEIGQKRSNELGLYDMTGNVSEWCVDYYSDYDTISLVNPKGPDTGLYKVIRGGDFRMQNLYDLKTTTRYYASPYVNRKGTGMRLVINIKSEI
ncbi:MAG: SUMF1/EgtB/PvdO family nonheme iron enzyme [Bacteroidales bacterium]|nr:SUMF1/EgtB/PvdO family nonheme iron enzyme [Bacteroidales bacterium]